MRIFIYFAQLMTGYILLFTASHRPVHAQGETPVPSRTSSVSAPRGSGQTAVSNRLGSPPPTQNDAPLPSSRWAIPWRAPTRSSFFIFPGRQFEIEPKRGFEEACPVLVQVHEEEVKRSHVVKASGDAPLRWLTDGFSLVYSDKRKAKWEARLKEPYHTCEAKAWLLPEDAEFTDERGNQQDKKSHLTLTFSSGKLVLALDVNSIGRATSLLSARITEKGRPEWEWQQRLL